MILYPQQLPQDLKGATLFLDTNVFSAASKNKEFADMLASLKSDTRCAFATIPSVLFEVANGSSTAAIYNERTKFVTDLVDTVNPLHFLNDLEEFSVVMAKMNASNKAYTDFLLAACLYQYQHVAVYLLTRDLRALPSFYDRTHVITLDEPSGDVKNFGLYRFNKSAYDKAAARVLTNDEPPELRNAA